MLPPPYQTSDYRAYASVDGGKLRKRLLSLDAVTRAAANVELVRITKAKLRSRNPVPKPQPDVIRTHRETQIGRPMTEEEYEIYDAQVRARETRASLKKRNPPQTGKSAAVDQSGISPRKDVGQDGQCSTQQTRQ